MGTKRLHSQKEQRGDKRVLKWVETTLSLRIGFLMLNEQEWEQEEESHTQGTESISVPNTMTTGSAIRNRGS